MFGKLFSKVFLAVFMVFMMLGVSNAVELTDGVHTGMQLQEVKSQIDLKHHITDGQLEIYRKVDSAAFYAFNMNKNKLVYKIVFYPDKKWDKMMDNIVNKFGNPVERPSNSGVMTYFWSTDSGAGIKLSNNPDFENVFQLWYGSVPLWDELAENHSKLSKFAK